MSNSTLFDLIESMDNTVRIASLRIVCNSSMAKCIGAIRQHLRTEARTTHEEKIDTTKMAGELLKTASESNASDLDQRNFEDENSRSTEELALMMGQSEFQTSARPGYSFNPKNPEPLERSGVPFNSLMPMLAQAAMYHVVYDHAAAELQTLSESRWEEPMTLDGMLTFMTTTAQPVDKHFIEELAKYLKTTPEILGTMQELVDRQDREQLTKQIPEIKSIFHGFGENGYSDILDDMDAVFQHQLGVKLHKGLKKAKENLLKRILRSRRLANLSSVTVMDEGIAKTKDWVLCYERAHRQELGEAIDAGADLQFIED